jgi:hypothetical protein
VIDDVVRRYARMDTLVPCSTRSFRRRIRPSLPGSLAPSSQVADSHVIEVGHRGMGVSSEDPNPNILLSCFILYCIMSSGLSSWVVVPVVHMACCVPGRPDPKVPHPDRPLRCREQRFDLFTLVVSPFPPASRSLSLSLYQPHQPPTSHRIS